MAIAKASCTCATCGQKFEVRVAKANSSAARSFEKWAEENITECRDCESKRINAAHEEENAKATEAAKNSGWPELVGTPKQIAWAETIRKHLIDMVADYYDDMSDWKSEYAKQNAYAKKGLTGILLTVTSASWWISHREDTIRVLVTAAKQIDSAKYTEIEENLKSGNIPEEQAEEKQEEPKQETKQERPTAMPEKQSHSGCADVRITDGKVAVLYDRDETFRQIVKSLGFSWSSGWTLKICETTGTGENICAELGNKLLNSGFAVRFDTKEIMDAAVTGNYTPMHMRWVYSRPTGFYVSWAERSDTLYREARSIPGAKYDAPGILVPDRSWDALADFAEKHDFRFTAAAAEKMETLAGATEVVNPEKPKEARYQEKNVLDTSREVLDDLRDA